MTKRTLHIDRLRIRLRGVSQESARAAAEGLGTELLNRIGGFEGSGTVDAVRPDPVHVSESATPSMLRNQVADSVADAVRRTTDGRREA